MLHQGLVLLHLVGFAAYLGAGFAQQQLMKLSARQGIAAIVRDEYERLAATIVTRIELPAIFAQVATGITFIALSPILMRFGWLHGKLTTVLVLLVLSHLEMFNARRIVKARASGGESANADIAKRKVRHAAFGLVGTFVVVILLGLVVYGTA